MGKFSQHRKLFVLTTVLAAFIVVTLACEIGIRSYHWIMSHWRATVIEAIVLDPVLGWRATENYSFSAEVQDYSGNPYLAEVSTEGRGFRVFGDPEVAERPKVLFLGDSFTHAIQVSAGDAYYSTVGQLLGFEVFAYGVGGYGTLQELMVLRRFLELIHPDVVVLQLCSNDLINNHYGLESSSTWNNNGLLRPYWEDGKIEYRIPRPLPSLRRFASEHSEFLYFIFSRFDKIVASADRPSVEQRISRDGLRFPPFAEAAKVTARLLREIRVVTPADVPVFAFCTDDPAAELGVLRSSSEEAGLVFIDDVPEALRDAESHGVCTRAADGGHWNPLGHQLVAEVLIEVLARELVVLQQSATDDLRRMDDSFHTAPRIGVGRPD